MPRESSTPDQSSATSAAGNLKPPVVWSIAGHDPSSGAGLTADLLTFAAHGIYAATVPTALTAQSTLGVAGVELVRPEFLDLTLRHLLADLPPAGIKIGMLGSAGTARVIGAFLETLASAKSPNANIPIVFDTVLISSSGVQLYPFPELGEIHRSLLPHVTVITPNWAELAALADRGRIANLGEAREAADQIAALHPQLTIVTTGGDQAEPTDLLRLPDGSWQEFRGRHFASDATHGTGCAFSSALLAGLVLGRAITDAVSDAKRFVEQGIRLAPRIGHGRGPLALLHPPSSPENDGEVK